MGRYGGTKVFFFIMEGGEYKEADRSLAFPPLTSAIAATFLEESVELKSTARVRRIREWARQTEQP